ncbi:MAG: hypothetical protein CR966_01465 [Pseudomonadales bacterium]|nr:MAG: hypothetical protein CR966_01465 [Pseudomonadales bacterium]
MLIFAGLAFVASWNYQFLLSMLLVWVTIQVSAYIISNHDKEDEEDRNIRLTAFWGALTLLLGHLCYFKYSNFFISTVNDTGLFADGLTPLDIVLPLGISFYTFQGISYLYDLYHEKVEPLPATILLGILTFIPTLTAGPIFRPKDAQHQWMDDDYYDYYYDYDDGDAKGHDDPKKLIAGKTEKPVTEKSASLTNASLTNNISTSLSDKLSSKIVNKVTDLRAFG